MKQLSTFSYCVPKKVTRVNRLFFGKLINSRSFSLWVTTVFLLFGLIISTNVSAQVSSGIAPVNNPTGRFHIEGNLQANTPTVGIGDWLPGIAGAGGNVLNAGGVPLNAVTTFKLTDPHSISENNFSGGKKFNDDPNIWTWTTNPVGAKCDINNAMIHFTNATVNGKTHTWVIVAADRKSNSGSAYIDFEFYQNTLSVNSTGTFSSAGVDGGRTRGDLLLTLALTNGGGTAEFFVNRWQNIGGTSFDYVDRTSATPAGAVLAATNAASVPVSFPAFGGNSYSTNLFAEAAIDLTALLGALDPCASLGIKTLFVKTKTSPAPTATIVDFITPQQVQLQLGLADAGLDQSKCGNNFSVTGAATPSPGDAISSTAWSVVSGAADIASLTSLTSGVTVTSFPATLRFTVKTAFGCTVFDDVVLNVLAAPAANAGSDVTINCTTTSTTLGASGGVSYSWSPAAGLSATNIANPVATPVATTTYTVTVTGANGCTKTDDVIVTVDKALPAANAGSDVTINCTTTNTTLGASGGVSYSWSPAAGLSATNIANPVATPVATTTYTVTVTGANGCTKTDDVIVTVNKTLPPTPTICVVEPSLCGPTTGSVTILSPLDDANNDYEYRMNGGIWQDATTFTNLAPGSLGGNATGFEVRLKSSGCVSLPAKTCASPCSGLRPVTASTTEKPNEEPIIKTPVTSTPKEVVSFRGTEMITAKLESGTTVAATPNPFSDRLRFVVNSGVSGRGSLELFNMMGQKLKTVFEGFIEAGKTRLIEYNVPFSQRSNVVYVFRVGDQKVSGKLTGLR